MDDFNDFRRDLAFRLTGRCKVCRGKHIVRYRNSTIDRLAYNFYRCQDCDFIFVHPTPDLSSVYSETLVPELGEGELLWNKGFLSSIEKFATAKGKLLEIGFGNASFLKLAQDNGWEVHGVELSPLNVRWAREEMKLPNIKQCRVEEAGYPPGFFDVVAAFNFIEHVADPAATLEELRELLRPGGLLVLLCPNMSGIYHQLVPEIFGERDALNISWVPPVHLSYFNKSNFKRLFEEAGFSIVGDESRETIPLWLQHKVTIGPKATGDKLEELRSELQSSKTRAGSDRVAQYRQRMIDLLVQRMTWQLVSDCMELEEALGSECAILYIGQKSAN